MNAKSKKIHIAKSEKIKSQSNSRYLETSLIDVDVEPKYVRATIKGKIFQMALNEEVRTSDTTSVRSQMTGHLLITMPKLSFDESTTTNDKNTIKSGKETEMHSKNKTKIVHKIMLITSVIRIRNDHFHLK